MDIEKVICQVSSLVSQLPSNLTESQITDIDAEEPMEQHLDTESASESDDGYEQIADVLATVNANRTNEKVVCNNSEDTVVLEGGGADCGESCTDDRESSAKDIKNVDKDTGESSAENEIDKRENNDDGSEINKHENKDGSEIDKDGSEINKYENKDGDSSEQCEEVSENQTLENAELSDNSTETFEDCNSSVVETGEHVAVEQLLTEHTAMVQSISETITEEMVTALEPVEI